MLGGVLMRKFFLLLFFFSGCGQPVEINYHYDTLPEVLEQKAGYPVWGFAEKQFKHDLKDTIKGHLKGHWQCDIYLESKSLLSEDCWNLLIAHELRHCYEGNFHSETPEGSAIQCVEN